MNGCKEVFVSFLFSSQKLLAGNFWGFFFCMFKLLLLKDKTIMQTCGCVYDDFLFRSFC